jgi:hypothetical protein
MKIITITKPVFLINVHNPQQVSYDVDILSTPDSENWKLLEAKEFYKRLRTEHPDSSESSKTFLYRLSDFYGVIYEQALTTKQPVEKSKVKEILGTRIFDEATILEIEKYVLSKQKPDEPQKFYNKLVDRLFHNIEHECLNRQALLFANTDCNDILNKLEQLAEVYNSFYGTCYTKQNIEFTVFYLEARKPEYVIRHFDKFHPIFLETYKKLLYLQSILQIKPLHSIYEVFTDFKIAIERQLMK